MRRPWILLAALLLAALPAGAGPLEAARRLEEARKLRGQPWPVQAAALQHALAAAQPTDRTHTRALAALASLFEREGLLHASLAFEARGAALGPERDEGRLARELTLALHLREEGDLESAGPRLRAVLEAGRAVAPRKAARALVALAEDARDLGDRRRLEVLYREAQRARLAPSARLRLLDALGQVRAATDDLAGARRALAEAERVWRAALQDDDPKEAARVARLWLDLDLRHRLAEADPARPDD